MGFEKWSSPETRTAREADFYEKGDWKLMDENTSGKYRTMSTVRLSEKD